MYKITDLAPGQCRYPVSGHTPRNSALCASPTHATHFFCGEPVETEGCSYCDEHAALCYGGPGVDWRELYQMMTAAEATILYLEDAWNG